MPSALTYSPAPAWLRRLPRWRCAPAQSSARPARARTFVERAEARLIEAAAHLLDRLQSDAQSGDYLRIARARVRQQEDARADELARGGRKGGGQGKGGGARG